MRLPRYATIVALLLVAFATLASESAAAPRSSIPVAPQPFAAALHHVYNLSYSNGTISTFTLSGHQATLTNSFRLVSPKKGSTNGIGTNAGLIYTAVDAPSGKPCASCLMVLRPDGSVVEFVNAPTLSGAPGSPDITDVSVDANGDIFASDYGQQATYYYFNSDSGLIGPNIVSQGTSDAASVGVAPNAKLAFVSGGCGFASVRTFTRQRSGKYTAGSCFGIGTIALIGGSVDNAGDVATPVDGVFGLVSISNPSGSGIGFSIPDRMGSVGSVAFSATGRFLYVADAKRQIVYAFARPAGGWTAGPAPKHVGTYTGFKSLNIIAVD